jgi:hypothetical protein
LLWLLRLLRLPELTLELTSDTEFSSFRLTRQASLHFIIKLSIFCMILPYTSVLLTSKSGLLSWNSSLSTYVTTLPSFFNLYLNLAPKSYHLISLESTKYAFYLKIDFSILSSLSPFDMFKLLISSTLFLTKDSL